MEPKSLADQYAILCARLGDLLFKQDLSNREIASIRSQLESLATLNKNVQESQRAQQPVQSPLAVVPKNEQR